MLRMFLALALLGNVSACASRARRSVSLYESGDYAGASRAADEGLARHPGDDSLWAMKVRATLALGDAAGIAKAYEGYMAQRGEDDKELLRDVSTATIAQALGSPSVRLKIAAIEAVAALEIHALTDQVTERIDDDDDRVAATAAVAVLRGIPGAARVADELLSSENAEARRIVIEGIGKKFGKLAVADLQKAANDRDPRVRRAAIRWLGQIKDTDSVAILTRRMKDPDESVRAATATALARIGPAGAGNLEAFATQALADRALAVRLAGADLLAAAKQDAQLAALVDDKDPMVALTAAVAVKRTRPELVQKALDRALAAEEWTIRAGAANTLVMAIGKQAALPLAQRLAADKETGVRLAAARVMLQAGDKAGATAIFRAALADESHGLQAAADLAALGDAEGVRALSAAALDPSRTAEQRSAAVAAHRSAHRVTPGLVAALADASGLVRVEAAFVLGTLARGE